MNNINQRSHYMCRNDRYNSMYHERGLILCIPAAIGSAFYPVFLFVVPFIAFNIFCNLRKKIIEN